jgi:hypothetical protein
VDLIGGIQAVTLSDEEAAKRGTQKTVLERKAMPSFDTLIEIDEPDLLKIYRNLASVVDAVLRGNIIEPETRRRVSDKEYQIERKQIEDKTCLDQRGIPGTSLKAIKIYCNGIKQSYIERAIKNSEIRIEITNSLECANYILSVVGGDFNKEKYLRDKAEKNGAIYLEVRKNNLSCVKDTIRKITT